MHKEIPVFLLAIILLASCDQKKVNVPINEVSVEAPFEMPMIKVPDFSDIQRFVITDFGAEEDDQQATSQAIVTAISAAVEAGGGRIVIPAGEWPTGKIHLKSNINIHLEEGATLLFSEDPKDYLPAVKTTWEGMECFNYSP